MGHTRQQQPKGGFCGFPLHPQASHVGQRGPKRMAKTVSFFSLGLVVSLGLVFFMLERINVAVSGSKNQTTLVDRNKVQEGVVNNLLDTEPSDDAERSVLMVVAHPDDEALWGGEYLLKEGPKVHMVVTCTQNSHTATRFDEFKAVQEHLGYHGEFLDGKDSISTTGLESHIQRRIQSLVCGKNWERIITHGPEGEYGHPQHHIVHDAVLDAVRVCCRSSDKLFVFEPHPSKNHAFSEAKEAALKLYESQQKIIFRTFGNWMEKIVPFKEYDYKTASTVCRDHQNPKKKVHPFRQCRLHKKLDFSSSNYQSDLSLGTFSGQGSGC